MVEEDVPGRTKPPPHSRPWRGDVPTFPKVGAEAAADALLHPDIEERGLERRTVVDLRAVLEEVLQRDPDDVGRLFFSRVVVPSFADLRGLEIPFALSFGLSYFPNGLSLSGASFEELGISGHYIGGNLELVQVEGEPSVSLQNVQFDNLYLYESDLQNFTASAVRAGFITLAESSVAGAVTVWKESEVYDNLSLSQLRAERGIRVTDSRVHELLRLRDVGCGGDLDLSETHLACEVESRETECELLDLRESLVGSTANLRGVAFETLNVLGARIPGRLLLDIDQLRGEERRFRSGWETPSRVEGAAEGGDVDGLSKAADQLQTLREHFGSMPSMAEQDDYCAYRVKEVARRLEEAPLRRVGYLIEKWALGYLLVVPRTLLTAATVVLGFALLYGGLATGTGGDLLLSTPGAEDVSVFASGAATGWLYCLLFSVSTFATVSLGVVTATGRLGLWAAIEGTLGVLWVALFIVVLARRIVRW